MDSFFSTPIAFGISGLVLAVIGLLLTQPHRQRWVLGLSLFLYLRYLVWRGLYTIPSDDLASLSIGWIVYLAELYGFCQFAFFTYQSWSPLERQPVPLTAYPIVPTVDMMVTVVDEPLEILSQTLVGCLAQDYPKDRFRVYVLDDGHRPEVKTLAESLGCGYLRRSDRPRHAKAGNLNHALRLTDGDLIAVFDVDHVPTRAFLQDTVGFFTDPKVAIVQTPHHFYNPDIFQRNLRVGDQVKNEQALFFRALQVGRDGHNSAFFAGSGGLFRRTPLEEIGGFQTATITEDIHTSMQLHAKGYTSCYLNRVLSAGLMPETFEGYLKQRKRWAMGCIQVLQQDNPLTKRGLTLAQRLDYFGSIFYFFFGTPRLICLVAPLASLLFQTPPLKADVWALSAYFFSFYIASAMVMSPVSRGSRNPFWSDIYEIAMCFSLSAVALKTLATPRKERPFEVTPKGQRVKKNTASELSLAWPLLLTFALLIVGLVWGIQHWREGTGDPGLPVSLFWGSVNLFLLTIALFVASEQTQGRHMFRLNRDFAGEILIHGDTVPARVANINERGAALVLDRPLYSAQAFITLLLTGPDGAIIRLSGRIVRQAPMPSGQIDIGLLFTDVTPLSARALTEKMFGDPAPWQEGDRFRPGIASSVRSLLQALSVPWRTYAWNQRRMLRIQHQAPCRLNTHNQLLTGYLADMSFSGVSAVFGRTPTGSLAGSLLELPHITLKVSPVAIVRRWTTTLVRFRVDSIERGESHWREWHEREWQQRRQEERPAQA
ncbi:MAG: glycosyltransferase [Nitrospira sp.]|jgi:cellulose synthase (UDP-forming)|nr:glycosyltransferase [Nitrospira sp.]